MGPTRSVNSFGLEKLTAHETFPNGDWLTAERISVDPRQEWEQCDTFSERSSVLLPRFIQSLQIPAHSKLKAIDGSLQRALTTLLEPEIFRKGF